MVANPAYEQCKQYLMGHPKIWLITGVAGFIGSHLLSQLLELNQKVIGIDNFATGSQENLAAVQKNVSQEKWQNFTFIEGDICDRELCRKITQDIDYVLHQAALASVPRSINNPMDTHDVNVTGFLNILNACRESSQVKRLVYASSSSVYGDHPKLPKIEAEIGQPVSPYAANKFMNEVYANTFSRCYEMTLVGLRYFNVFGPRQNPNGPYAAVIPLWLDAILNNKPVYINGDGETSRDFCNVVNVVQANILSAVADLPIGNFIYNVAAGERTTLNELYKLIQENIAVFYPEALTYKPSYRDFRAGDVRHSLADISKITQGIGYQPQVMVKQGIYDLVNQVIVNRS
jgi:UDP-N-acetylglucosamine 4-epimerase